MAAPADVLKMIKDKEVKFVDLRFTDTRGKEQHVQVPAKQFTQDKFDNGHAFDGSSIAGWKGIEASDMLLMPDPDSARIDPFTDETTLQHHLRRGRAFRRQGLRARSALARQARRGVPQVHRPRRHRVLRPGARVLHLRLGRRGTSTCRAATVKIESEEAPWSTGKEFEGGNMGASRRRSRAAISRCRRSIRCRTSAPRCASRWRSRASRSRCTTTKSPPRASARSAPSSRRW